MPRHGSSGITSVVHLLRQREISGGGRRAVQAASSSQEGDGRRGLGNFAEEDFLRRCSASYCDLNPPPRSTIATAFSPDGRYLASTHGDHTVKVICHRTGQCLKVLSGHRRTPWVVRFHPTQPHIVASGSLDYEVRVWDVEQGKCLICFNFGRPIASLAFHAAGNYLAVASGHKLYMWEYAKEGAQPMVVLKTRRSLRAVHFQPHGIPLLLTAEVNDGNPPSALPLPISPDLEEPALLPNSAQGLGTHGQLPPLGPAPPSNLTPSLAQGGQPYSAAQQILGITSRASGVDARGGHMQPHPDQALLPAQQAPVHARPHHSEHSLSGLPSFQEMAAGLAHADHDHAAQLSRRMSSYAEDAQMSAQHLSHQPSGHLPFAWLPGQGRRQPAARPGAGPGMGAEPTDWHRQGVSTLDLRSRPPRQRGAHRRGRESPVGSLPPHLAAGQPWPGSMGTSAAEHEQAAASGSSPHEAGPSNSAAALQSIAFSPFAPPAGAVPAWQMAGMPMHAGAVPGFPFYQQQPVGGFPRRWPAQLTGLSSGFTSHSGPLQPIMFPGSQDALSWDSTWRPVMPQAGTMPMLQARPAPQASAVAGRFGFSWPSPGGWTDFRPFQMFRGSASRDSQQGGRGHRHRDGSRGSRGDSTAMPPPAGEVTQDDLVEQFDSRWLGAGEFEHTMAQPESLDGFARGPDFFSRGMHAALPPSMVPVGWEYPAHLLQPSIIRAGEPTQATYPAAESAAASQPGQAHQDAAAVRASAAAANVISNEQPCRVKLRIWRYSPTEDVPGTSGAMKGKAKDKAPSSSKQPQNGDSPAQQQTPEPSTAGAGCLSALLQAPARVPFIRSVGASSSPPPAHIMGSSGSSGPARAGHTLEPSLAAAAAVSASGSQPSPGPVPSLQQQDDAREVSPSQQGTSTAGGLPTLAGGTGASSEAHQAMSDGAAGHASHAAEAPAAGSSIPGATSDGEGGVAEPMDTAEPMQVSQQVPEQHLGFGMPSQGASSGAQLAVGSVEGAAGLAAAAAASIAATAIPAPEAMNLSLQQPPQPQQAPSLLLSRAEIMAEGAPAGEEAGMRRGAVAQPQRASRHVHPKPLEAAALTISDAVLCSEMGVHFSPCGRLLAACVACQGPLARGAFPARARQSVVYEVRIYSIVGSSCGEVVWAKRIRAAHCLTSLQFSPTSEHILLAYGRRHVSLLRSLVADAESSVLPYHTIVEVYRVAPHMPLMRVLPSAADEVNAALFHPFKGGGIAYGTKEGRLRVLRHSASAARGSQSRTMDSQGSARSLADELIEADQLAAAQVASSDED